MNNANHSGDPLDRLRRLEILVRAAEAGSFARAARLLQVDPSAVSHAISQLERETGLTLFYRTTRQLRLTDDGEEICRRSRDVLSQMADIDAVGSGKREGLAGSLKVGMSVPIGRHVIIPRIPGFMRRHPDLRLECYVLTDVKDIHAGGLDLMLRAGEVPESGLVTRRIFEIRLGVYAAPEYLAAAGRPRDPSELERHRCFVHKPPVAQRPLDEWMFERDGVRKAVRVPRSFVTDDREGMIEAVLAGGGLMRIGMFDPALITSGRLHRVLPDWDCVGKIPVYALYRRGSRSSPKIAAFLRFAWETFRAFDPQQMTITMEEWFSEDLRRSR